MHVKIFSTDPLPKQYLIACQHFLTDREIKKKGISCLNISLGDKTTETEEIPHICFTFQNKKNGLGKLIIKIRCKESISASPTFNFQDFVPLFRCL